MIAALDNDLDADNDTLTITNTTNATGTTTTDGTTITYTPLADWSGTDTISYTIADPNANTATATVTITVNPTPDPPVANNDTTTTNEDQTIVIAALDNDLDADNDTLTITNTTTPPAPPPPTAPPSPTPRSPTGPAPTPSATRSPTPTPTPPPPPSRSPSTRHPTHPSPTTTQPPPTKTKPIVIAALDNDLDADNDTLTITNTTNATGTTTTDGTTITYTPLADWSGTDTISYTIADPNANTATATVTITVNPTPDPPRAADDAYTTFVDQTLVAAAAGVLGNDSDEDGEPLTASLVSGPTSGSLTLNPDGSFSYTPASGFAGTATFVYSAADGTGLDDLATVTIEISDTTTPVGFYLGTSGTDSNNWDLQSSANPVTEPEPDHDGDGNPGLTVRDSSMSLLDLFGTTYQQWNTVVSAPLVLRGPATLDLWSTAEDFDSNDDIDYSIWLRDCAANGTGCTTIAFVDDVHVDAVEWRRRQLGQTYPQHRIAGPHHRAWPDAAPTSDVRPPRRVDRPVRQPSQPTRPHSTDLTVRQRRRRSSGRPGGDGR